MNLLNHFKNKKIYIVTDSDLDGISSYIVSKIYLEPIVETFSYLITGDRTMGEFVLREAQESDVVIFVDIAPTEALYIQLKELKKEIFIFDHHLTSYNELMVVVEDNYFFTEEKCGCKIFFDELTKGMRTPKTIFQYVQLVDTYDRYQKQSLLWKEACKLQDILYEYVNWGDKSLSNNTKYNLFINRQLEKIDKGKIFYFTQYEEALSKRAEEKKRRNLQVARKTMRIRKDNSGNNYIYLEANSKLSHICNALLGEYDDIQYIVSHSTYLEVYENTPNGKLSLRSAGGFNVGEIAKLWSGGGHPNSAGIELDLENFNKLKKGELHLI